MTQTQAALARLLDAAIDAYHVALDADDAYNNARDAYYNALDAADAADRAEMAKV